MSRAARDKRDFTRPRPFLNDRMRAIDIEVTRRAAEAVERSGIAGLSVSHGRLMAEMDPGGTRPSRLAQRLGVTKAAVGQLVARLEERGLVERAADPADGRAMIIRPTADARKAYRVARVAIAAIEDEWRAQLGPRNLVALDRYLTALEAWVKHSSNARRGGSSV